MPGGANKKVQPVRTPQLAGSIAPQRVRVAGNPDTAQSQFLGEVAATLRGVSKEIGKDADKAAKKVGELEGLKAGLDPEFRPRRGLTIRDEAFNRAGLRTFELQLDTRIRQRAQEAFNENEADPKALKAAFDALAGEFAGDDVPEQVRPAAQALVSRVRLSFERQALRNQQAIAKDRQRASFETAMSEQLRTLQQQAFSLGLDSQSDDTLAKELDALRQSVLQAGPGGDDFISATAAARIMRSAGDTVTSARVLGAFRRLQSPAQRQQFLSDFEASFLDRKPRLSNEDGSTSTEQTITITVDRPSGQQFVNIPTIVDGKRFTPEDAERLFNEGKNKATGRFKSLDAAINAAQRRSNIRGVAPSLSLEQFQSLTAQMQSQIRSDQVNANKVVRQVQTQIKSAVTALENGITPTDSDMDALRGRVEALGDDELAVSFQQLQELRTIEVAGSKTPPAVLETQIEAERARLEKEGVTPEGVNRVRFAERMLENMRRDLARDPLAFASRVGLTDVPAIDTSSADALAQSLQARAVTAETIAQHYGVPAKFFTDDERDALAQRFREGAPSDQAEFATAIATGFGDRAPQAMTELGSKVPAAAYLGALRGFGKQHAQTLTDGFRGLEALRQKAIKLPERGELSAVFEEEIGNALDARQPATRANMFEAAKAVYAARALDQNLIEFDKDVFRQAVNQVAGRFDAGGEARGGVADFNGRNVILPQHMTEGDLDTAIFNLTDDDLAALSAGGGAPVHVTIAGRQRKATRSDFQGSFLVTVGPGRYQVSMTDPSSAVPQFLLDDATGLPYVLDLSDPAEQPTGRRDRFDETGLAAP